MSNSRGIGGTLGIVAGGVVVAAGFIFGVNNVVTSSFDHVNDTRDRVLGSALKEYDPSAKLVEGSAKEIKDGEAYTAQAKFGDDTRTCTFPVGKQPTCK